MATASNPREADDLTVRALGDGRFLVTRGTRSTLAHAVATSAGAIWVTIDGDVFVIDKRTGLAPVPHGIDEMALAAPMPATVASIVGVGTEVSEGDVVAIVEAMKMEFPIRAPHAGRIARVASRVGELVQPGIPLVEIDSDRQPPKL